MPSDKMLVKAVLRCGRGEMEKFRGRKRGKEKVQYPELFWLPNETNEILRNVIQKSNPF